MIRFDSNWHSLSAGGLPRGISQEGKWLKRRGLQSVFDSDLVQHDIPFRPAEPPCGLSRKRRWLKRNVLLIRFLGCISSKLVPSLAQQSRSLVAQRRESGLSATVPKMSFAQIWSDFVRLRMSQRFAWACQKLFCCLSNNGQWLGSNVARAALWLC